MQESALGRFFVARVPQSTAFDMGVAVRLC